MGHRAAREQATHHTMLKHGLWALKRRLPFVYSFRTWLTLPPWEREPALYSFFQHMLD
jgi:hypothetical protein